MCPTPTDDHGRSDRHSGGTMDIMTGSVRSTSRTAPRVLGPVVDDMTRCVHYRTEVDIVAIRFACCNEYYPCHRCHEETADHAAQQWRLSERDREAVLCGACGSELTIASYLATTECPNCRSPFNERCRLHTHLYFETSA
jgi:uncharacterized CHY-type Zn-finger protein